MPSFKELHFAKVDVNRLARRGFPEVIFAPGKTASQMASIAKALKRHGQPVVITKLASQPALALKRKIPWLKYFPKPRMAVGNFRPLPGKPAGGLVWVVTAGTADIPVAEEALLALKIMGCQARSLFDVGVAGLARLTKHLPLLRRAKVIVVVAGMDGVLASLVSGLVASPVVAVPTSVGYGASFQGIAPLLTMLNSCSPGVGVVNIDNGFGAGYLAGRVALA
ncbi:MAG: nickel pincer cofactor biosynthesis protein LarB [Candidatus Omnitrophica bacterium]|nr:nickel pincer cofactor biosynthesis protein LarB [Candidatus Omnitrophota bacterium]